MRIITNRDELKSLEEKFKQILIRLSDERIKTNISHRGGMFGYDVYYSSKLNIWFTFDEENNRYWNAFGIGRPGKYARVVVEVNIPKEGVDRRIGGVFLKDESGRVCLGHRGKIGGGARGVGPRAFWNYYKGDKIDIPENREIVTIALIGCIDSPDFPEKIKQFIVGVDSIKEQAKS